MKAMLRNVDDHGRTYQALMFVCPGCEAGGNGTGVHMLPVNSDWKTPSWGFDGNLDAPTLTHTKPYVDGRGTGICHSFLVGGVFQFLGDSTHPLAGQHVPMPDLPDWIVNPPEYDEDDEDDE